MNRASARTTSSSGPLSPERKLRSTGDAAPNNTRSTTPHPEPELNGAAEEEDKRAASCTYNAERVIGNGTFGIVYQAQLVEMQETVAIKKVFVDKRYKNRELQIMKEMKHPNIVTLKHAFYTSGDTPDELFLNMVMEYMPETVYRVMRRYIKMKQQMPLIFVKLYTYQVCRALAHIHVFGICHRDIKPQNLLVDSQRHSLKLCDFGSAKKLSQGRPNIAYICSRYYRAPELIFGSTDYSTAIDMWSTGCVMAEMILGQPLFPGENGVDQLVEIVKVLGSPTKQQVLAMNPKYTNFTGPIIKPHPWTSIFRQPIGDEALDIMGQLLQYDPEARLLPLEANAHCFFDELRDEGTRMPNNQPLPDLFNLTKNELRVCNQEMLETLIPRWYQSR